MLLVVGFVPYRVTCRTQRNIHGCIEMHGSGQDGLAFPISLVWLRLLLQDYNKQS